MPKKKLSSKKGSKLINNDRRLKDRARIALNPQPTVKPAKEEEKMPQSYRSVTIMPSLANAQHWANPEAVSFFTLIKQKQTEWELDYPIPAEEEDIGPSPQRRVFGCTLGLVEGA